MSSFTDLRKPPSQIQADECRVDAVRELVKAAATTRTGCGHLCLQSIGSSRMSLVSSTSHLPHVKPMTYDNFGEAGTVKLPEAFASRDVAGYLLQCAAHANEEYMGSAIRAAANMGPAQRAAGLVLTAFNSDSAVHSALVKAGSSCLGKVRAWVLMATDDTDPDGGLVDNLIALHNTMAPLMTSSEHAASGPGKSTNSRFKADSDNPTIAVYHVSAARPADAAALRVFSMPAFRPSLRSLTPRVTVVALSSSVPATWLPSVCGGTHVQRCPQISLRVMVFIKPLKQYFAAAIGLLSSLQRALVPASAAAVLHSVARQANVSRLAFSPTSSMTGDTATEAQDQPHEYAAFSRSKTAEEAALLDGSEPERPMSLALSEAAYNVRCNRDQQSAVEKLTEGVFLVHGPPGTGKSTTIFHMINTRVRPSSNLLITAARNVAVVALLDKLTRSPALARQVVVIGSEGRLGHEAAPFLLPRLLQAPARAGDCAWPHLAFLVYRALASMHAAAREAHAHELVHGDPHAVEPQVNASREQLVSFDGLKHISAEQRARLLGSSALAAVQPLPCIRHEREASAAERLQARAAQVLLLQQALYCLRQLRTYQVLKERRIRMCTIDSAPRLAQTFSIAASTLQKELVDATLLPKTFAEGNTTDVLPVLPQLARALLNFSVFGAYERLPSDIQEHLSIALSRTALTSNFSASELRHEDIRQGLVSRAGTLLAAHDLHPEEHHLQVLTWLASIALWAASRGLLEWVRWPRVKVHYPGAPLPPVLALAHCFVRPGSTRYATAFGAACRAKDADPITIALQSVAAAEDGGPIPVLRGGSDVAADCTSSADDIVAAVQAVHAQLQAVRASQSQQEIAAAEAQARIALAAQLAHWTAETLAHTLAVPLYALAACRTSLLQVQRMHATRIRQAALAEHCHAHNLPDAEGFPAADLGAVASSLQALAAAGVSDLEDIVAGSMMHDIRALQTSELKDTAWGFGLPGARYEGVAVDVAVVDEAGCVPDYALPVVLSFMPANLVLVGDPRQLQASSEFHNTHVPRGQGGLREYMQHHSRSTMERLSRTPRSAFATGGSNASTLTTQYRMHSDVCHVVSEHFYRGRDNNGDGTVLRTDADIDRVRAELLNCMRTSTMFRAPPQGACQLITMFEPARDAAPPAASHGGAPPLGLTTAHRMGFSNTDEAFIAVHVAYLRLQQLLEAAERLGWSDTDRRERFRGPGGTPVVFILTPYRKQVFLCKQVLHALHALPDYLSQSIVVQTIDQCQGDEADAVVLSLVISFDLPRRSGVPGQPVVGRMAVAWQLSTRQADAVAATDYVQFANRANVALSRTRYHLTIVASASVQFCMRSVLGVEVSLWGRVVDTRLSMRAAAGGDDDGRIVFHGGASNEHDGCTVKPHDVGSRGPQLLLSVNPAPAQPDEPSSQWSHRKICPGDNVTLVDTADFTVQAVHFAFAALLLLAYHVDCLQCFVGEEEAWRRLVTESGPLPQESSARQAEEARLRSRLPHFRQGLIRKELEGILLALFPCWTSAQCRHILNEAVFEGDIVDAIPPEPQQDGYPAQAFAPLITAFQAAKVAAVFHQATQAAGGNSGEVAAHIRRAVDGAPQRQPVAVGQAIVSLFQSRQAHGDPLFQLEDVRGLACVCTRLQLMALLPGAHLEAYVSTSAEAAEMLQIFGRVPPLLASLPRHDRVNANPAFPQPGGDWAAQAQQRPMRLLFVAAWPMADTQWRHIVDDNALMHVHTMGLLNEAMMDSTAHAAFSSPAPGRLNLPGRTGTVHDAAAATAMHRLRQLAAGPSAADARDHAAFARSTHAAAALQQLRLMSAALPPVLTLDSLATLTASCRKVLQDAAVFHRLIVEGLDAGDIAGHVARAVLELETAEQAAQRTAAHGGAPPPASMIGASAPHVLLVSTRASWVQLQHHPHIHLSDPYGTFRRPEWALLDSAAASRASADTSADTPGAKATGAPAPRSKQALHTPSTSPAVGPSATGSIVASLRTMHERQADSMQGLLALVYAIESDRGRVAAGGAGAPASGPNAVFQRRVWVSSGAAATLCLRTVLDAEEPGDAREGVSAALSHAAAAARTPSAQHVQQRLAGTPWDLPAMPPPQCPFHLSYTFLPLAQAGRDVATPFCVPSAERAATLGAAVPPNVHSGAAEAEIPDAWNQCIDRAEVCVLLRELAKIASGEAQSGAGAAAARRHAVAAMGDLCAHYLTSHSPGALPPEMAQNLTRQLFFSSWAVMDTSPKPLTPPGATCSAAEASKGVPQASPAALANGPRGSPLLPAGAPQAAAHGPPAMEQPYVQSPAGSPVPAPPHYAFHPGSGPPGPMSIYVANVPAGMVPSPQDGSRMSGGLSWRGSNPALMDHGMDSP